MGSNLTANSDHNRQVARQSPGDRADSCPQRLSLPTWSRIPVWQLNSTPPGTVETNHSALNLCIAAFTSGESRFSEPDRRGITRSASHESLRLATPVGVEGLSDRAADCLVDP